MGSAHQERAFSEFQHAHGSTTSAGNLNVDFSSTILVPMLTVTFDTLKFTKRLEGAGVAAEHVEAIAEAFSEATGTELATKDYLRAEMEAAKSDMIKWMAGLLLAQAGLITALVKLL